jgi:hypothetical protein
MLSALSERAPILGSHPLLSLPPSPYVLVEGAGWPVRQPTASLCSQLLLKIYTFIIPCRPYDNDLALDDYTVVSSGNTVADPTPTLPRSYDPTYL